MDMLLVIYAIATSQHRHGAPSTLGLPDPVHTVELQPRGIWRNTTRFPLSVIDLLTLVT